MIGLPLVARPTCQPPRGATAERFTFLSFLISPKDHRRLAAFMRRHRLLNQSEALRRLVRAGLNTYDAEDRLK